MNDESPRSFNLERILVLLRRRGPIVLACVLIVAGSAYLFVRGEKKAYTSTAAVLFSNNSVGSVASGLSTGSGSSSPVSQSQQDTNVALITLGNIPALTAGRVGHGWTPALVAGSVSVSASSDTSIVDITATAGTPALAQVLANTYANTFVSEQARQTGGQIKSALALVNTQFRQLTPQQQSGPQGLALANRAQSLGILAKLDNGGVSVVGAAPLPSSPSAPKVSRDVMLGAVLGLLLGIGIVLMLERLDYRIRDPKDLAAIYDVPLLASVPERAEYQVLRSLGQTGPLSLEDEVFSLLRSYLRYFGLNRELRTLLVISAEPGEGKTSVSYNLAKAAVALGSSVLLVEGDLRHTTVLAPLLDQPEAALPDVLIGDHSIEDATHAVSLGPNGVLDVILSGHSLPPNAGELLDSGAMEALIEQARAAYEFVVIDTPPISLFADAIPLLTKVDGVIVVGRMGKTRRDTAEQLRSKLASVGAPVVGVVANCVDGRGPSDSGYYGRRYRRDHEEAVDAALRNGAGGAEDADGGPIADKPRAPGLLTWKRPA